MVRDFFKWVNRDACILLKPLLYLASPLMAAFLLLLEYAERAEDD